jgi:outer membrane biosynthesis protein TonB
MSQKSVIVLSCALVLAAACSDMPREAPRDTPPDPSAAVAGRRPIPAALRAHTGLSHLPEPADRTEFAARLESHYPAQFRAERVSGTTLVDVHVDDQGRVGEVEVIQRPVTPHQDVTAVLLDRDGSPRVMKLNDQPEFGAAAQAALRETRFLPALKDGKPVAFTLRMTVQFDPPAAS